PDQSLERLTDRRDERDGGHGEHAARNAPAAAEQNERGAGEDCGEEERGQQLVGAARTAAHCEDGGVRGRGGGDRAEVPEDVRRVVVPGRPGGVDPGPRGDHAASLAGAPADAVTVRSWPS